VRLRSLPGQGNNVEQSLLILSLGNLFYLTLDRKLLDPQWKATVHSGLGAKVTASGNIDFDSDYN